MPSETYDNTELFDILLYFQGTVEDPILLTSRNDPLSAFSRLENREWPDARLVDGDAPNKGRLQVRYKSRWMSVCTNSKK